VVVGPKANGQIEVVPTTATGLILALPDTASGSQKWELAPYDESVLKLRGEPEFVPVTPGSKDGARVWAFDVVGPGATDLQADYKDASGMVSESFFVSISVQVLTVTPH
jgi:predicted secreted protein